MKVLIFGATGMVGQGVLRECLAAPDVENVVAIGRSATGIENPKLKEIAHKDMSSYEGLDDQLTGFDACFFCLGVSSAGMSESDYQRVTYDLTLAAAKTLSRLNPDMAFIYVSGMSTDSSEMGRVMWARVKGKTENALLRLPFHAWMFRPGIIQPMDGIKSKTPLYRAMYILMTPLLTPLRWALPNMVVTTREIGQAMLAVARFGYGSRILETKDIRAVLRP
jgi:uncharacterized protein YbjT (DUF2867 family)